LDGGFAEGFIFGFFGFKSVSLGHFNLVVLLEATNEAGSYSTPDLSVSKTNGHMPINRRFCLQAHSSLWRAKLIMKPFEGIVPMVWGGLGCAVMGI
jgi:hypothetical protein